MKKQFLILINLIPCLSNAYVDVTKLRDPAEDLSEKYGWGYANKQNATDLFGNSSKCYSYDKEDDKGNVYEIERCLKDFDNTTYVFVKGRNRYNYSEWRAEYKTRGNKTEVKGIATNGNEWNETIEVDYDGSRTISGRDSKGNYFNYRCDRYNNCY